MLERIHLEIIAGLSRYGSLSKAADELCLTQSALSHSIKKLEELLGVDVWVKKGRNLRLTQAGEFLLSYSEGILNQFAHIEDNMKALGAGSQGHIRIGVECHPCYQWLIPRIRSFLRSNSTIEIDVTRDFQFSGIAALKNHHIDLVLTPDPVDDPELEFEDVLEYELQLLTSSADPISKKTFVEPEDLRTSTIITYPVPKARLDIFRYFLAPAQIAPRAVRQVESTEIMLLLVEAGKGICTLPQWLVAESCQNMKVYGLRLGKQGMKSKLWIGRRRDDALESCYRNFIDFIKV